MDINVKVKEKGKQSIGLQGGISGLAGGFIGLTYQTNNFLGLGETLTFSAQFGDLQVGWRVLAVPASRQPDGTIVARSVNALGNPLR